MRAHRFSVLSGCSALLACVALAGCGDAKTDSKTAPDAKTKTVAKAPAKRHPPHGPHHGHVFALIPAGFQHVHVEVTDDDDAKQVTAYLLDAEMDKEIQSSAPEATIDVTTAGKTKTYVLKGELKDGKTSQYVSKESELFQAFEAKDVKMVFHVELDGKRYDATVLHVEH